MKQLNPNKNYKVRVTYANKHTKSMVLTGQQIIARREMNDKTKEKYPSRIPYIQITVLDEE